MKNVLILLFCRNSLQFYRGADYDITEELNQIIQLNKEKALHNKNRKSWTTTFRRIFSSAFGKPFLMIGVIRILNQWGESSNLTINMIQIFRDSNSSVEPELAPVFVGVIQVQHIYLISVANFEQHLLPDSIVSAFIIIY